jgi:hypothetical protein
MAKSTLRSEMDGWCTARRATSAIARDDRFLFKAVMTELNWLTADLGADCTLRSKELKA